MQQDIVAQGVELMLFGMGTVVVFLALLVVATSVMSAVVGRFFPEAPPAPAAEGKAAPGAVSPDAEIVAAITAAVHRHRNRHRP
ncbi:oxaloacetate decarboxylase [Seongchinamella sediminis]|uniref:Probable oxaloacetate decarboxylase gamma chain n=1 Tax=Seongchinamella sediminis TaxID=2283635 RepID=A0A3L7DZK3_9GAMM|nr:OadG family protein [Seongchinamella sediminis]RLQ22674.1 oxaloacetate decarboxylase [Seongchinamella sediminis]